MFFPLHCKILFTLSGIELYKFWMYSKGILSNSSWQIAQRSSIFLGNLWKTLFFSRLQNIFDNIDVWWIRWPVFENFKSIFGKPSLWKDRIMCRSVILLQFFAQKHPAIDFDRIYRSTDFLETFRPSWAMKPQSINFFRQISGFPINSFSFRYWVNNGLILIC